MWILFKYRGGLGKGGISKGKKKRKTKAGGKDEGEGGFEEKREEG